MIAGEGQHAKMLSYLTVFERILHTEMVATANRAGAEPSIKSVGFDEFYG